MTDLRSFADNLFPSYDKIIIAGHFNLPNISWTDANYTLVGSLSQNFCDILVTIILHVPTLPYAYERIKYSG
jgi:hypothetical protein